MTIQSIAQTPVKNLEEGLKASQGWSKIPNDLVRDTRLSAFEFRLFCALDARQGSKPSQDLRRETLAEDLSVSKSTISRGLKKLQELNYLDVHLRPYASRYYLKNPARTLGVVAPMTDPLVTHDTATDKELLDKEPKQERALSALVVVASNGELTNKTYTETVLKVITAETGVNLTINPKTLKACSRALQLGYDSPHAFGLAVALHYKNAATSQKIISPSGFIVSVSMRVVLEGETTKESKPTPTPPRYNPNQLETLCPTHGEQGHLINACPPCRQLNREQENLSRVISL